MLIECDECSHKISNTAEKCPSCGALPETFLGRSLTCAECGSDTRSSYLACQSCGAPKAVSAKVIDAYPLRSADQQASQPFISSEPIDLTAAINKRPWARWLAKSVDGVVYFVPGFAWLLFVGWSIGLIYGAFGYNPPEDDAFWNGIAFIAYGFGFILIDTLTISVFGNTLGKSLMGLSIRPGVGAKRSLGSALKRAAGSYLRGCGLSIPIVALIAEISCYNSLTSGRPLSWEEASGLYAHTKPVHGLRWFFAWVIALAGMFIFAGLAAMNRSQTGL